MEILVGILAKENHLRFIWKVLKESKSSFSQGKVTGILAITKAARLEQESYNVYSAHR